MKCLNCQKETTNSKFCNQSCSAKYSNTRRVKNKIIRKCIHCNSIITSLGKKYCSILHQRLHETNEAIKNGTLSAIAYKRYLLKTTKNICSVCNLELWNNKPIPLDIDHIDGNPSNNSHNNLRLICCNCHAQTPTFKGKNKGHGRFIRAQRYRDNKSY